MRATRTHVAGVLLLIVACASAPRSEYPLTSADLADAEAMKRSMPRLAEEVLAGDGSLDPDDRFRLEILTGRYREAAATLARTQDRACNVPYEVFVHAKIRAEARGRPFPEAFAESFRESFARLDDRTAALAARAILVSARTVERDLVWALPDQVAKTTVSLEDALTLLRVVQAAESYREFAGLPEALVAEDDARRYELSTDVAVKTPDGATVCAVVVRPRGSRGPLPALFQFTIYADPVTSVREAVLAASNGYVGVTGFTRGKACSPDETVPYVHDGADAAAMIDWIAAQPWSDGRVGMYGGSYSGFTAWAAAKHRPKALKAILVGAPVAPGIDVPMEGNVFWNFVYPWPFYTTNDRWLDAATYDDHERWNRLNREWYLGGRPYRELERIDGTPNPVFAEWLAHPALDEYWRAMVPQGKEYADLGIPVLQTAGYFHGGPGGALHYFLEHLENDPDADHRLLIGPYDHLQAQRGVVTPLGDTSSHFFGYETDPVAWIDIVTDLKFRWFDHVLRGGPLPELLQDRLNYQVMGANVWKHAPSLAAASNRKLRLYFSAARSQAGYTLSATAGPADDSIPLTVDLADRSDVDDRTGRGVLDTSLDETNGITLVSDPLEEATEVTGVLSGHLELIASKKDFDFTITPYEWMPDGTYFQLPPYTSRASHVESPSERKLLAPGELERLDFGSRVRMMSRRVGAGSRLVIVLSVVKNPRQQINYGTGEDVSGESVAGAGEPLSIRWLAGSYVEFPVATATGILR